MAERLYAQKGADDQAAAGGAETAGADSTSGAGGDDVVDAEFEEVKDNKN
jgi:molecular chaperone DnaK